jgi:hypothetical protein
MKKLWNHEHAALEAELSEKRQAYDKALTRWHA